MTDYFKPKSLTWWAGVFSLAVGVAMMSGLNHPSLGAIGEVLGAVAGADASPASLITLGVGLIGLRAKLARSAPD